MSSSAREISDLDVVDGDHGGGAALARERRHLADQLTAPADREHHLALVGAVGDELDVAREHQHDVVSGRSGAQDRL